MSEEEPEEETVVRVDHDASLDRRAFLNGSWKVLGLALVVEAGWTSYDILNPKQTGGFGGVVDAGPVENFLEEGTVQEFLDGRFYVTQYQGAFVPCIRSART